MSDLSDSIGTIAAITTIIAAIYAFCKHQYSNVWQRVRVWFMLNQKRNINQDGVKRLVKLAHKKGYQSKIAAGLEKRLDTRDDHKRVWIYLGLGDVGGDIARRILYEARDIENSWVLKYGVLPAIKTLEEKKL